MTSGGRGLKVLITGTPGVGKTTQCRKLARVLDTRCISLGEILPHTPYVKYLEELVTYEIVDLEGARSYVWSLIKPGDVLDTHVVELSPDPEVAVVLRKAPDVLFKELSTRPWPLKKVLENVWSEVLDVVYVQAVERWRRVYQIDVTKREPDETLQLLIKCVKHGVCIDDRVDWLSYVEKSGFLDFIENLSR
ncbi:MAG: adenylate kinase family protein [Pyrobaculum sp.]